MSVVIETPRSPRSRKGAKFERWGWLYMRVSGLMLWLALIHGTNGMRTIANDYAEREWIRKTLNVTLWVVCAALIIIGTLVVTTFDPCVDPSVSSTLSVCTSK